MRSTESRKGEDVNVSISEGIYFQSNLKKLKKLELELELELKLELGMVVTCNPVSDFRPPLHGALI